VYESIEALEVLLLGGEGSTQITASLGAAAATEGGRQELIAAADTAV
jgi:MinD-like ATPase involved in chromosome partitioning or flagellar assembly